MAPDQFPKRAKVVAQIAPRQPAVDELIFQCKASGLTALHRVHPEYRFHPKRKWRIDLFIEPNDGRIGNLGVEIQGGGWKRGRHSRALGMAADYEKWAHMLMAGIRPLPVTPEQVTRGEALQWIQELLR